MREISCNYCEVRIIATNYSTAQSLLVEHNRNKHFSIDDMIENWKSGYFAASNALTAMMDRTGFNKERMYKTLLEDGHDLFVRTCKLHDEYRSLRIKRDLGL